MTLFELEQHRLNASLLDLAQCWLDSTQLCVGPNGLGQRLVWLNSTKGRSD